MKKSPTKRATYLITEEQQYMKTTSLIGYTKTIRAKIAAAVTLVIFLGSSFINPQTVHAALGMPTASVPQCAIPAHLGTVKEMYIPDENDGPFLVYIQDAHANYEAQKNIAGLLDELHRKNGIDTVCIEGGEGPRNVSLMRSFPLVKERRALVDRYVKEGIVSGAEECAINADDPLQLIGIDDNAMYMENVDQYVKTLPLQDTARRYFDRIDDALWEKGRDLFSPALFTFVSQKKAFESGESETLDYVRYLCHAVESQHISLYRYPHFRAVRSLSVYERKIRMHAVQHETKTLVENVLIPVTSSVDQDRLALLELDYAGGRIDAYVYYRELKHMACSYDIDLRQFEQVNLYYHYLMLVNDIDAEKLLAERVAIEGKLEKVLSATKEEKGLLTLMQHCTVLANLFTLTATPDDLRYVRKYRKNFCDALFEENCLRGDDVFSIDANFALFERFYQIAEKREDAFIKRTMIEMKKKGAAHGVLIAGGYHTPGITKRLKRYGIAHMVVSPRLSALPKENIYHKVMRSYEQYTGVKEGSHAGTVALVSPFLEKHAESRRTFCERILPALITEIQAVAKEDPGIFDLTDRISRHSLETVTRLKEIGLTFDDSLTEKSFLHNLVLLWNFGVEGYWVSAEDGQTVTIEPEENVLRRLESIIKDASTPGRNGTDAPDARADGHIAKGEIALAELDGILDKLDGQDEGGVVVTQGGSYRFVRDDDTLFGHCETDLSLFREEAIDNSLSGDFRIVVGPGIVHTGDDYVLGHFDRARNILFLDERVIARTRHAALPLLSEYLYYEIFCVGENHKELLRGIRNDERFVMNGDYEAGIRLGLDVAPDEFDSVQGWVEGIVRETIQQALVKRASDRLVSKKSVRQNVSVDEELKQRILPVVREPMKSHSGQYRAIPVTHPLYHVHASVFEERSRLDNNKKCAVVAGPAVIESPSDGVFEQFYYDGSDEDLTKDKNVLFVSDEMLVYLSGLDELCQLSLVNAYLKKCLQLDDKVDYGRNHLWDERIATFFEYKFHLAVTPELFKDTYHENWLYVALAARDAFFMQQYANAAVFADQIYETFGEVIDHATFACFVSENTLPQFFQTDHDGNKVPISLSEPVRMLWDDHFMRVAPLWNATFSDRLDLGIHDGMSREAFLEKFYGEYVGEGFLQRLRKRSGLLALQTAENWDIAASDAEDVIRNDVRRILLESDGVILPSNLPDDYLAIFVAESVRCGLSVFFDADTLQEADQVLLTRYPSIRLISLSHLQSLFQDVEETRATASDRDSLRTQLSNPFSLMKIIENLPTLLEDNSEAAVRDDELSALESDGRERLSDDADSAHNVTLLSNVLLKKIFSEPGLGQLFVTHFLRSYDDRMLTVKHDFLSNVRSVYQVIKGYGDEIDTVRVEMEDDALILFLTRSAAHDGDEVPLSIPYADMSDAEFAIIDDALMQSYGMGWWFCQQFLLGNFQVMLRDDKIMLTYVKKDYLVVCEHIIAEHGQDMPNLAQRLLAELNGADDEYVHISYEQIEKVINEIARAGCESLSQLSGSIVSLLRDDPEQEVDAFQFLKDVRTRPEFWEKVLKAWDEQGRQERGKVTIMLSDGTEVGSTAAWRRHLFSTPTVQLETFRIALADANAITFHVEEDDIMYVWENDQITIGNPEWLLCFCFSEGVSFINALRARGRPEKRTQTTDGHIAKGMKAQAKLDGIIDALVASRKTRYRTSEGQRYRFVDDNDPLFPKVYQDIVCVLRRQAEKSGATHDFRVVIGPEIVLKQDEYVLAKMYRDNRILFLSETAVKQCISSNGDLLYVFAELVDHEIYCRGKENHDEIIEQCARWYSDNRRWENVPELLKICSNESDFDTTKGALGILLRSVINMHLYGQEKAGRTKTYTLFAGRQLSIVYLLTYFVGGCVALVGAWIVGNMLGYPWWLKLIIGLVLGYNYYYKKHKTDIAGDSNRQFIFSGKEMPYLAEFLFGTSEQAETQRDLCESFFAYSVLANLFWRLVEKNSGHKIVAMRWGFTAFFDNGVSVDVAPSDARYFMMVNGVSDGTEDDAFLRDLDHTFGIFMDICYRAHSAFVGKNAADVEADNTDLQRWIVTFSALLLDLIPDGAREKEGAYVEGLFRAILMRLTISNLMRRSEGADKRQNIQDLFYRGVHELLVYIFAHDDYRVDADTFRPLIPLQGIGPGGDGGPADAAAKCIVDSLAIQKVAEIVRGLTVKDKISSRVVEALMQQVVSAGIISKDLQKAVEDTVVESLELSQRMRAQQRLKGVFAISEEALVRINNDENESKVFRTYFEGRRYQEIYIFYAGECPDRNAQRVLRNAIQSMCRFPDAGIEFVSIAYDDVFIEENISTHDFIHYYEDFSSHNETASAVDLFMRALWREGDSTVRNKLRLISGTLNHALVVSNALACMKRWRSANGDFLPGAELRLSFYLAKPDMSASFLNDDNVFQADEIMQNVNEQIDVLLRRLQVLEVAA